MYHSIVFDIVFFNVLHAVPDHRFRFKQQDNGDRNAPPVPTSARQCQLQVGSKEHAYILLLS